MSAAVKCRAHWCSDAALQDGVLCERHDDMLPAEIRSLMRAAIQAAVAWITQAQMRRAFEALPEESKEAARQAAKTL